MQNRKMNYDYILLPVPAELFQEAGIQNGIMEMYAADGRIVIQSASEVGNFVCDGNCHDCPMNEIECDGECGDCPCSPRCDESEEA